MHKKFLGVYLILFCFVLPSVAWASFPDVFSSNAYKTAIDYVQQKGIVSGYGDGRFRPNNPINRAEFVKILVKAKFSQTDIASCTGSSFKDVPSDQWYAPYVCLAKKKGVVSGNPDGTFAPINPVAFSEAAKILRNTMLPNDILPNDPSFTQWYEPYVSVLANHNAIPVSVDSYDYNITRGDMAEMIYRLDAKVTSSPSLTLKEIPDRRVIVDYYSQLGFQTELAKAYDMKADPGMTLDAFEKLYQDGSFYTPSNFTKTDPSTYSFTVIEFPNISAKQNKPETRYQVSMQVVNGKLKTLSSKVQDTAVLEQASNGGTNATLEWDHGTYKVYYTLPNGAKTLAYSFDSATSISPTYQNLAVSSTGKYLTFESSDWESGGVDVYDIAAQKEHGFFLPEFYGFTAGDKNFYYCSGSGMSSGDIAVVTFPGFDNTKNLAENGTAVISGCGPYDPATRTLHYQFQNNDGSFMNQAYQIP